MIKIVGQRLVLVGVMLSAVLYGGLASRAWGHDGQHGHRAAVEVDAVIVSPLATVPFDEAESVATVVPLVKDVVVAELPVARIAVSRVAVSRIAVRRQVVLRQRRVVARVAGGLFRRVRLVTGARGW